jgi:hypothetical protein
LTLAELAGETIEQLQHFILVQSRRTFDGDEQLLQNEKTTQRNSSLVFVCTLFQQCFDDNNEPELATARRHTFSISSVHCH